MHRAIRLLLATLLLCCAVNARADLVADPAQLDFEPQVVGFTSAPMFVTLRNTGAAILTVVELTPAGSAFARAGGTCGVVPFALAAQASCTLGYTFAPFFVGPTSNLLRATPDVGNFANIKLIGQGIDGGLTASPGQLGFPLLPRGGTAGPLYVTLSNTGTSALSVVSLTPASGVYARAGGTCGDVPFTLASLASCTLGYTFSPTSIGTVYQSLRATPNAGDFVEFTLAGEADEGHLSLQPATVRFFQPVPIGGISGEEFATLENTGRVALGVTSIGPAVVPPVPVFVRTGGTCPTPPFALNAFNTCTVGYTFAPVAAGEVSMDVRVENTVSSAPSFTLSGAGLPGNDIFADGFDGI